MLQIVKTLGCALALVALCSCADLHGQLNNSTARLEHSSSAMARDAANVAPATDVTPDDTAARTYAARPYPDAYVRDTHVLAVDAHQLRRAVESGAPDADIQTAFDRVSRSYHAVRDEVEHSDSRDAQADLRPVTADYADVERAMRGDVTRPVG
jgi:hypothetical protein